MNWLYWALLAALFAGVTAMLAKKVGVKEVDSNLTTAIRTAVVLVFACAIAAVTNKQPLHAITPRAWLFLGLSGLAGASWLCYFRALQLGKASQVAPIDKLSVVVAMLLAAVFLSESMTAWHWLGGLLMVAGAVMIARA